MEQYTVQITEKALSDMEDIYNYIADQLQSPETAMGQYNRIADAIEKLNIFPKRMKIMESDLGYSMGLRQLLIDYYSAFYVIKGERVMVIRVLYSASDINARLL